ncbi:MAG: class I tRNA ligase family protein, partial [Proteobacteria bacterium]|nr:class I tRNA ligase family protein [Pseudomonadota bacterium]
FTLCALAVPGRDIKLSESRVAGYRNFATKLWNAARYCLMNGATIDPAFDPKDCKLAVNRWIAGEVARTVKDLEAALETYRFNEAANALYHFTWGSFCDWYLEFTKPILAGADAAAAAETRATIGWALSQLLHLLHPFMPFITEELWEHLGGAQKAETGQGRLIAAPWPSYGADLIDPDAAGEMDWVIRLISEVRAVRAEMNVPAAAKIPLLLRDANATNQARLERHRDLVTRLARLSSLETLDGGEVPKGAVQIVLDEATAVLPLAEVIDVSKELDRLKREMTKADGEIAKFDKKLANAQFLSKAPSAVVEEQRERRAESAQLRDKLAAALERLAG